jgi:quercetin dioxygenase-like cupin family protein
MPKALCRFLTTTTWGLLLCVFTAFSPAWAHDDTNASGVLVRELARTQNSWNGAPLPAYPRGRPEIRILSITIPAGEKLPLHLHPVINAGVLLSGRLRVQTVDDQTLELEAGEAIVEVVNTWHRGQSLGPEPAHIVVFYAGTPDVPITEVYPVNEP